ncbi:MAG: hypothetical protein E7458_00670, partial [Ruminococcaceae bacterium]|nr:hypothetical protein [Oscillospiraceae bacterium]
MKRKRILSFVLALAMLLSLMSTATYAEGESKELVGIEVTKNSNWNNYSYEAYQTFEESTITVNAIYSDNSEEILEEGQYEITYEEGRDSFRAGDTEVSICFGGKSTTLTVDTVSAVSYYAGDLIWSTTNFTFDGNPHTIYLTNLPVGMSAKYEDNQYTYVGDYVAKATLIYNENDYQVTYPNNTVQRKWKIIPAQQPISIKNTASLTKGGAELDLNELVSGAQGDVSFTFFGKQNGCSITEEGILISGDTLVDVKISVMVSAKDMGGSSREEYESYSEPGAITVTITDKPTAVLNVVQPDGVFGRELASPTFDKPEETIEPVITYQDAEGKSIEKPIYPGSYTVTVTYETDTYIYKGSDTFTIAKAEITPVVTITDWTYGGGAQTPVVTGNAGNGAVTYTYAVRDSEEYIDAVPTNAGAYTVKATIAETANYLGASATADFTIRKATIAPKVYMEDWTYGEAAKTPVISGNTGNGGVVYTYAAQGSDEYSDVVPFNAGAYTVRAEIAGTDNYEGTVVTDDFTIKKANIAPTIQIANWTYGAEASVPSVDGNPGNAAVTYLYTNATYSSAEVPTEAGSYTVTATVAESANYLGDTVSTNFTIGKAEQVILGDLYGLVIGDEVDLDTIFDAPGELSYQLNAGDTGSTLSDSTLTAGA